MTTSPTDTSTDPGGNGSEVFADGSYDSVFSSGGWAFVVYRDGVEVHADQGRAAASSNNAIELQALYQALTWIDAFAGGEAVVVWTDSLATVEGSNRWRPIWRNNGWRRIDPNPRSRKRSVPDAGLWQAVDAHLLRYPQITVSWCKGHTGSHGNERADALARAARFVGRS